MSVSFPCVAISWRNSFRVVNRLETLVGRAAERSGTSACSGLGLLDTAGTYWPVTAFGPPEPASCDPVSTRRPTMGLTVGTPTPNGIEHAIQLLCEVVDHASDDLFDRASTREALKRQIRAVEEAKELIELVGVIWLIRDICRERALECRRHDAGR